MTDIAVGVPMFCREEALRTFLGSLPEYVSTVYIADNGADADRPIYRESWPFDIDVLDIEYDAGIGPCRAAIVDAVDEPYVFIGDNDMELTREDDLRILQSILDSNPAIGGVSGWLLEGDTIRTGARDLHQDGETLFKEIRHQPDVRANPVPFATFDFIPQAGLFQTVVFDDYSYDAEIFNSEHIDFFYGHLETAWEFASTPAVLIQHHRDIDPEYRASKRGKNRVDLELMADKWGVADIVPGARSDWIEMRERTVGEHLFDAFRRVTPPTVWVPVRQTLKRRGLA